MKQTVYALLLIVTSSALAATSYEVPSGNVADCKAQVEKQHQDAIKRLDSKRREMGVGMPMIVYTNKLSRIDARYKARLKSCATVSKRYNLEKLAVLPLRLQTGLRVGSSLPDLAT